MKINKTPIVTYFLIFLTVLLVGSVGYYLYAVKYVTQTPLGQSVEFTPTTTNINTKSVRVKGITNSESKSLEPIEEIDEGKRPYRLVKIDFAEPIPAGTSIVNDPHYEYISFGTNINDITLAPVFWDTKIDLEPGSYTATLYFMYHQAFSEKNGVDENNMAIFTYDSESKKWEEQDSEVDTSNNLIRFTTSDIKRISLGNKQ